MKILQELPARCSCPVCDMGCQCGDCSACSNATLDGVVMRNAKNISIAACLLFVSMGFVFFVPVVALGVTPTVTQTLSLKVEPAVNATRPMGSIGFCYLGVGAVFVHGAYYPSVAENQTATRFCS